MDRAETTAKDIASLGGVTVKLPTIQVVDPEDWGPLERSMRDRDIYELAVVTSGYTVDALTVALKRQSVAPNASGLRCVAVGSQTAERLKRAGFACDSVAKEHNAASVIEMIAAMELSSESRILLPQADDARPELAVGLAKVFDRVDVVEAYGKRIPDPHVYRKGLRALRSAGADAILFTSPSTVHNLCRIMSNDFLEHMDQLAVVAIGATTQEACLRLGVSPDVVPRVATVRAALKSLAQMISTGEDRTADE